MPNLSTLPPDDSPDNLYPDQLAAHCQNNRSNHSHEPFCLELFRRAIVKGSSLCWDYLHRLYYPLVRYWVNRRATRLSPDEIDDLVQDAFITFYRFYTPDRLAQAQRLGEVLRYLESCVATTVAEFWRRRQRSATQVEWKQETIDRNWSTASAEAIALENVQAQEIWSAVEARCQNRQERVIVRLSRVGAKPRQIAAQHPRLFPTVQDVYRVKRTLFKRLSRDPIVRMMYEKNFPEHSIE